MVGDTEGPTPTLGSWEGFWGEVSLDLSLKKIGSSYSMCTYYSASSLVLVAFHTCISMCDM